MLQAQSVDNQAKAFAVFGQVDALGAGPQDRNACRLQGSREVQWGLTAELDDHAQGLHSFDHVENILDRERLEEQAVRGVIVGADGLRVGVDHHYLVAVGPKRKGSLATAVVELDPLPDPVRPAPQDHHPRLGPDPGLVLVLVG